MLRILLFCVCIVTNSATAQETKLGSSLEDIRTAFDLKINHQGLFKQKKYLNDLPFPLHSSGHYQFDQSQGLNWYIEHPLSSHLKIETGKITQYENGQAVFQIDSQKQPMLALINSIFLSVFSNQWQQLEQHFEFQTKVNQQGWQLELRPKSDFLKTFSRSIILKGDTSLQHFRLVESNGDKIEIDFLASQKRYAEQ